MVVAIDRVNIHPITGGVYIAVDPNYGSFSGAFYPTAEWPKVCDVSFDKLRVSKAKKAEAITEVELKV